jgi:hypothetical protein
MLLTELATTIGKNDADIISALEALDYKATTKKKVTYKKVNDVTADSVEKMPKLTFAVAAKDFVLKTFTSDGIHETTRHVPEGAIIISGPNKEKYYPSEKDLKKNWVIAGDIAHPEQNIRMVAKYTGKQELEFWPPWPTDKKMPLLPGDYVVKEGTAKFYRIGKSEYEQTYNPPGNVG